MSPAPKVINVKEVAERVLAGGHMAAKGILVQETISMCSAFLDLDGQLVNAATAVRSIDKLADGKTAGRLAKAQFDLDFFADNLRIRGYLEKHNVSTR